MGWIGKLFGLHEDLKQIDLTKPQAEPTEESPKLYRLLVESAPMKGVPTFEQTGEAFKAMPSDVSGILEQMREANGRCYAAEEVAE